MFHKLTTAVTCPMFQLFHISEAPVKHVILFLAVNNYTNEKCTKMANYWHFHLQKVCLHNQRCPNNVCLQVKTGGEVFFQTPTGALYIMLNMVHTINVISVTNTLENCIDF